MVAFVDRTGDRVGRLVVLECVGTRPMGNHGRAIYFWNCQCDCGNLTQVSGGELHSQQTQSCGCLTTSEPTIVENGIRRLDLTWRTFGRLTVLGFEGSRQGRSLWNVQCACGTITITEGYKLVRGDITSCGCRNPNQTHGRSGTREHHSWLGLRQRCTNPNNKAWPDYYGGRGIVVCAAWIGSDAFEQFYEDMGDCPEGMSLDRIDVDGPYAPWNCRWATAKEQGANKRSVATAVRLLINQGVISLEQYDAALSLLDSFGYKLKDIG